MPYPYPMFLMFLTCLEMSSFKIETQPACKLTMVPPGIISLKIDQFRCEKMSLWPKGSVYLFS